MLGSDHPGTFLSEWTDQDRRLDFRNDFHLHLFVPQPSSAVTESWMIFILWNTLMREYEFRLDRCNTGVSGDPLKQWMQNRIIIWESFSQPYRGVEVVWGFSGQIWSDYNSYHAVLSIQIYTSANTVNTILLPTTPTSPTIMCPTAPAMVNKEQKPRKKAGTVTNCNYQNVFWTRKMRNCGVKSYIYQVMSEK